MVVDLFMVYNFLKRLSTPFDKWEAYKLGIIDERGNILRKRKELRKTKERKAFGVFDVMVLNMKKLIEKVPGGKSRIASYAAALYLIREWNHMTDSESLLTENITDEQIHESLFVFHDRYINYNILSENVNKKVGLNEIFSRTYPYKKVEERKTQNDEDGTIYDIIRENIEEAPTVSAGSGAIAGIGVGPDGEPGLTKAQMKKYKKKNKGPKKLRDIVGKT